jgi:hypothetical protein
MYNIKLRPRGINPYKNLNCISLKKHNKYLHFKGQI